MKMTFDTTRTAAGYTFRLRSDIPAAPLVLGRLFAAFPEVPAATRVPTYSLAMDGRKGKGFALRLDRDTVQRTENPGSMLDWLISDITRKSVEQLEGFVAVHAGAVSLDGRAVILPAKPDSGKTTTVAGLTRAGFSYLSEEVALVHLGTSVVHPFPRSLVMEPASVEALDGLRAALPEAYGQFRRHLYHVAPADLRARSVGGPSAAAHVVVPRYAKGAETRLVPMTRAETLVTLAMNSFNLFATQSEGLAALVRIAQFAPGYRLEIGDLGSAVRIVAELVRDGAVRSAPARRSSA